MSEQQMDDALPDGLELTLDGGAGPARRIAPAQSSALIMGALDAWQTPVQVAPPRLAHARLAWSVAAISALIAAASLTALVIALTGDEPGAEAGAAAGAADDARSAAEADVHSGEALEVAAELDVGAELDVPAELGPDAELDVEAEPPLAAEAVGAEASAEPEALPVASSRSRDSAPSMPDDLLARANALRSASRWRDAESTYARVAREHPGTLSAYVADIAAAGVRRDHLRDPRGAARLYRRAIAARASGPLDLEARDGLARALRTLGDRSGEIAALRALVAAHPGSALAARARARIADLDAQSATP